MNYYKKLVIEKANAKEEKQNDRLAQRFARNGCYVEIYQTPSGRYRYKVTKDGKTKETFASVSDTFIDVILDAEATADKFNEKEEKDNASVQDRFRHKGCMITILKKGENQYTFTIEQNGREEGTNATYPTQDKAESEAKREVEANWNEKEENHYAKLAEEKAAKNNSRSWRIEFLGDSYYIETLADCDRALGKARQLWLAKEKALDDDIRWLKESFAKFERELGKIESEVSKQGTK